MNIDDQAKAIMKTAERLQRMHRLRKEIDTYVNDPLEYTSAHVRDAFKKLRGALTVEMTDMLGKMKDNPLWNSMCTSLEYELGPLSPGQLINMLCVLPLFTLSMGLVFKEDALPKPKKTEAIINDAYLKTVLRCLSGNTYRRVDEIRNRLDQEEPLFAHSEQYLRSALAFLVLKGTVIYKKLSTGQDSWRKPRKQPR